MPPQLCEFAVQVKFLFLDTFEEYLQDKIVIYSFQISHRKQLIIRFTSLENSFLRRRQSITTYDEYKQVTNRKMTVKRACQRELIGLRRPHERQLNIGCCAIIFRIHYSRTVHLAAFNWRLWTFRLSVKKKEKKSNYRNICSVQLNTFLQLWTCTKNTEWKKSIFFLTQYFPFAGNVGLSCYTVRQLPLHSQGSTLPPGGAQFEHVAVCARISASIGRPSRVPLFTATNDNSARVTRDVVVVCFRSIIHPHQCRMRPWSCSWPAAASDWKQIRRGHGRGTHFNFLFQSRIIYRTPQSNILRRMQRAAATFKLSQCNHFTLSCQYPCQNIQTANKVGYVKPCATFT